MTFIESKKLKRKVLMEIFFRKVQKGV